VSWLDRQSFLGPDSDAILADRTVGIIGLGGGGSHVAQQLAHIGIGRIVLIDPQVIEDTNLNRLVGATMTDVEAATPKVEIARRVILGVNANAAVSRHRSDWQDAAEAWKLCDVIVGGLDSVRAKNELDAFCRRFLIPYIDMGMDVHGGAGRHLISGQVVLSAPGTPCLRCLGVVTNAALAEEARRYGAAGSRPQVVWPNGVLASTSVGLAMQLLSPWHQTPMPGAYLEYDGNKGTLTPSYRYAHAAGRACPHYPANERGDPGFDVRRRPPADQSISEPSSGRRRTTGWDGILLAVRRWLERRFLREATRPAAK
jgi:molybdopterin-synthase adenylyltransferase